MSSRPSLRPIASALTLVLAGLVAAPVAARDAARDREPAKTARTVAAEPAGAWTAGAAPTADCARTRRKLWQAGEGWIVKTITICH